MSEPSPAIAHIIVQTRQNVELLIAHKHIPEQDGQAILARLPSVDKGAPILALAKQTARLSVSSSPTRCVAPKCRALWDWSGEDPNDLAFRAGEIIEIVAETNSEWWTGRSRDGKQGIFPAAYVEKLRSGSVLHDRSPVPSPDISKADAPSSVKRYSSSTSPQPYSLPGAGQRYASPAPPPGPVQQYTPPPSRPPQYAPPSGPPQQYAPPPGPPQPYGMPPGPPQPYGPPAGPSGPYGPPSGRGYYANNPPDDRLSPQLTPAPQQSKLGGLGSTMAHSAAGGVGFGAGAAIGSGIIDAIF